MAPRALRAVQLPNLLNMAPARHQRRPTLIKIRLTPARRARRSRARVAPLVQSSACPGRSSAGRATPSRRPKLNAVTQRYQQRTQHEGRRLSRAHGGAAQPAPANTREPTNERKTRATAVHWYAHAARHPSGARAGRRARSRAPHGARRGRVAGAHNRRARGHAHFPRPQSHRERASALSTCQVPARQGPRVGVRGASASSCPVDKRPAISTQLVTPAFGAARAVHSTVTMPGLEKVPCSLMHDATHSRLRSVRPWPARSPSQRRLHRAQSTRAAPGRVAYLRAPKTHEPRRRALFRRSVRRSAPGRPRAPRCASSESTAGSCARAADYCRRIAAAPAARAHVIGPHMPHPALSAARTHERSTTHARSSHSRL